MRSNFKLLRGNYNWVDAQPPKLGDRDTARSPKLFSQPLQRHEVVVGWTLARGVEEEHNGGLIHTGCVRREEHSHQCPVHDVVNAGLIAGQDNHAARLKGRHRHIRSEPYSKNQEVVEVRGAKLPVLWRKNVRDIKFQIRLSNFQVRLSKFKVRLSKLQCRP